MKVISPSSRIMSELEVMTIKQRIETCGRLCYKSEDKITESSADKFIKNVIDRGHNSVMEMASLTLDVSGTSSSINEFYGLLPKYLVIDWLHPEHILVTGSIRAFRELYQASGCSSLAAGILQALNGRYPDLFPGMAFPWRYAVTVREVNNSELNMMSDGFIFRHRKVAVKFIVNRAVSHEMVRHRPCSFLQESQRYCRYNLAKFGSEVTFVKPSVFFREDSMEYVEWYRAMCHAEIMYFKLLETSTPQAARTVLPNSTKTELIVYAALDQWWHMFNLRTSDACDPSMREVMIPLLDEFRGHWPSFFDNIEAAA